MSTQNPLSVLLVSDVRKAVEAIVGPRTTWAIQINRADLPGVLIMDDTPGGDGLVYAVDGYTSITSAGLSARGVSQQVDNNNRARRGGGL